ncbi:MAG: DUF3575 domain-containing protein [Duncaniella sp.]|nr:DUF3575 domain-containing protein [Duncaniella sp.]
MKQLFIILCALIHTVTLSGKILSDSVTVCFPASTTRILDSYMDNGKRIKAFDKRLDSLMAMKPRPMLRKVEVRGTASPEGSYEINNQLSCQRAKAMLDYLGRRINIPDSIVSVHNVARNWTALRAAVDTDSLTPDRRAVLRLLTLHINYDSLPPIQSDSLLQSLEALDGGRSYRFMSRTLFPRLREATLLLTFSASLSRLAIDLPKIASKPTAGDIDSVIITVPNNTTTSPHGVTWALRTNLLFDMLAAPTIGAELYLGHNFSVQGQWTYAWWSHRSKNFFWRIYGGDIGVRWWFGRKPRKHPLSGHHVGIYAQAVIWDFELGGRGYMGGVPGGAIWNRANIGAGVEYGYSMPVSDRWNIDFCIGIGYLGGACREYLPECGYYVWQSTRNLNYIGPTKAEISLVYRL